MEIKQAQAGPHRVDPFKTERCPSYLIRRHESKRTRRREKKAANETYGALLSSAAVGLKLEFPNANILLALENITLEERKSLVGRGLLACGRASVV